MVSLPSKCCSPFDLGLPEVPDPSSETLAGDDEKDALTGNGQDTIRCRKSKQFKVSSMVLCQDSESEFMDSVRWRPWLEDVSLPKGDGSTEGDRKIAWPFLLTLRKIVHFVWAINLCRKRISLYLGLRA